MIWAAYVATFPQDGPAESIAAQEEKIREALARSGDALPEGLIFVDRNPVPDLEAPTSQWPKILKIKRLGLIDRVMAANISRIGPDMSYWRVPGELNDALQFADAYQRDSHFRRF